MESWNVEDLVERSKLGEVSEQELDDVARALNTGAGSDTYRLLYVLGRMGSRRHEDVIAGFLHFRQDAQVAGLAVHILCLQWKLAGKYRDTLRAFLSGVDWDVLDFAKIAAISAAGEYLRTASDCPILLALLSIATSESDDLNRRFAAGALARALGESHSESVPPAGADAEAWQRDVVARASERFRADCGPAM